MGLVASVRPKASVTMAVFTLAGMHFSRQPISWFVVCMVLFIAMFAMCWNDLYDRAVDRQKGKTYAWENPKRITDLVLVLAAISFLMTLFAFTLRIGFGCLGLAMWFSSAIYPFLQTKPCVKNVAVAFTAGATVLFPLCIQNSFAQWLLFCSLTLLMSARELLGDVDGVHVERFYKRTSAMVWGVSRIRRVAVAMLIASSFVIVFWPAFLLAAIPTLVGAGLLLMNKSYAVARLLLELSLVGWGAAAYVS